MSTTIIDRATATGDKGGTVDVVLGAAPTSGNVIVFGVGWADRTAALSAIPNSMTLYAASTTSNSGFALYYKIANGTESATFSATLDTGGITINAWAIEYNGPDTYQGGATNTGTGTTASAGSAGDGDTTLNVMLAIADANGTLSSPSSGYTLEIQENTGVPEVGLIDNLTGASGSTPSVTCPSGEWGTMHITFSGPAASTGGAMAHHLRSLGAR